MCKVNSVSCSAHKGQRLLERILVAQLADIRADSDRHFATLTEQFLSLASCLEHLKSECDRSEYSVETKALLNAIIGQLQFGDALSQRLAHLHQVLEARASHLNSDEAVSLLLDLYSSEQEKAVHRAVDQGEPECSG